MKAAWPAALTRGCCVACGCTDDDACFTGELAAPCWWVLPPSVKTPGLCSRCWGILNLNAQQIAADSFGHPLSVRLLAALIIAGALAEKTLAEASSRGAKTSTSFEGRDP